MRTIEDKVVATENIEVATYDVDALRERFPNWGSLSVEQKLERLSGGAVAPTEVRRSKNTTCNGLYYLLVDCIDSANAESHSVTEIGVGDGSAQTAKSDTVVANEIGRIDIASTTDNGPELVVRGYASSKELNGSGTAQLTNVGVYAGDKLCNHSVMDALEKTDAKAATITVALSFNDING